MGHWEYWEEYVGGSTSGIGEGGTQDPQTPHNPLNPIQQEKMEAIKNKYKIPLNYFNILRKNIDEVKKRLRKAKCRALIGKANADNTLDNRTTISPFDQYGVISDLSGVAAETVFDEDAEGNRLPSGSINFTPLYSSPFFFRGLGTAKDWGIRGRNMTQDELRQLVIIHELVHIGDLRGQYDDVVGIVNSRLNNLIAKRCF